MTGDAMLNIVIQTREFRHFFDLIYNVFHIRVSFVDHANRKVMGFRTRDMVGYCSRLRRNTAFKRRCNQCDKTHLAKACRTRRPLVYRCHHDLYEVIVPLHDKQGIYLGAIFFGQLRPRESGRSRRNSLPQSARAFTQLPVYSRAELLHLGRLLEFMAEIVIEKEIIRRRHCLWAERIKRCVTLHLGERLTLARLSRLTGLSISFLTHHFSKEFGLTAQQFIRRQKMEHAAKEINAGRRVYEVASSLGYCDAFYFSKTFKAFWGRSPANSSAISPRRIALRADPAARLNSPKSAAARPENT